MSISVGQYKNNNLIDNKLNINSYLFSNVINLNNETDTTLAPHKDVIINFKNKFELGFSNNLFILNDDNYNIFKANSNYFTIMNNCVFNNDINIKNNSLYTSNNDIVIASNLIIDLKSSNSYFTINDNSSFTKKNLVSINKDVINFNINNSNKLKINDSNIIINNDILINSNNKIYTNYLYSASSEPIVIDKAYIGVFTVQDYNFIEALSINNDKIYNSPSLTIKKFYNENNNIIDLYSKKFIDQVNITSNKKLSINNDGYIGIGSNTAIFPIDIRIPISNSNDCNIIFFNNESNLIDKFIVNSRGYIGIGTNKSSNHLRININDDSRNIVNHPVIEMNLNYNSNNNYRTSNIINLDFIAINEDLYTYNDIDELISITSNGNKSNNFIFNFNKQLYVTGNGTVESPYTRTINCINTINNDYIENNNISSIINYTTRTYSTLIFSKNSYDYNINFELHYPSFLNYIKLNEVSGINPNFSETGNTRNITYITYLDKISTTILSRDLEKNYVLKEINSEEIYNDGVTGGIRINLTHKIYVEKNVYSQSFLDYITNIYQPPPKLLYATSNVLFSAALSADGKLELGDKFEGLSNDYHLYVKKKSRLNNLECYSLSSIPGKKNINFSYCNISNINKIFTTSNICDYIKSENAFFANLNIDRLNIDSEVNSKNIFTSNLIFKNIIGSNYYLTSNLLSLNMQTIMGIKKDIPISSNNALTINIDSNLSNGIFINSFANNLNPSVSLIGHSNNIYPKYDLINTTSAYSIKIESNIPLTIAGVTNYNFSNDSFVLKDTSNNNIILKHLVYNDKINNQFILGKNNIIFDLSTTTPSAINNTTNKISLGYPYKYLNQPDDNLEPSAWPLHFKDNILNSKAMLNVYGNVNLSTVGNKTFIKCMSDDAFPNEKINIGIGADPLSNYLVNINGDVRITSNIYACSNVYITSNLYVDKDIFVLGTVGNISDIRVKENIIKIKHSIEKIEQISGYTYTRIDTGKKETGLIAQEVLQILPEVININSENNRYNISYGNMCGLLVEGIKELSAKIKNIEEYLLSNNSNFQI